MKTAERPRTYTRISPEGWFDQIEFVTSISLESRLKTDPYIYVWTPEGLYSPNHKKLVKDVVKKFDPHLTTPDSRSFIATEEIVGRNESGTVLWFSPAATANESHKVVASEIYTAKNGAKIIFNYAVLFLQSELKPEQFVEAANRMAQYTKEAEIKDPAERRGKPLFLKGTSGHWTHFADIVLPNKEWGRIREGKVWKTKQQTLKEAKYNPHSEELYGRNPLSCPPNTSDVMFSFGEKVKCPNCKMVVYVKVGQVCPGCKQVRPC